ncbi:MAG: alpha-glucan family phosphorylase [Acidimicrobiales bacterium]
MKAARSFTVRARLPASLEPLSELAMNLRWSWDQRTRSLFRWVDPDLWERSGHDPVRLLGSISRARFEALEADPAFMSFLDEVRADLAQRLEAALWFQRKASSPLRSVAYFSPEFGISEALPQYSGGLGVLAGDHLKASSDLGVPLVAVGLFYREGYFRQHLDTEGWQQEEYPTLDATSMALTPVEGVRLKLEMAGEPLFARVWSAEVGRVRLYLLDTDLDENSDQLREVTNRLYGGDAEHRIRQEILLGMGGVLALRALGEYPQVFHTNEGHAAFLGLERIRHLVVADGLTFAEAVEVVRSSTIFTTHTPVPAGIDRFPRTIMERYFLKWAGECGIDFEQLMALGQLPGEPADASFNMALMALRLSGCSNGVSMLHGEVSREMFGEVWEGFAGGEVPIQSVTNGVHAPTWVAPEMASLFERAMLPDWAEASPATWARIDEVADDQLWRAREQTRARLVGFVRSRLASTQRILALSDGETWYEDVLDPHALTIGFARRFAGYKRATLLLSDKERLKSLLCSTERPVQLIYAGKAHPADELGKAMIREIAELATDPGFRDRLVFLEDYDISVGRVLYQGCDVWLNTPRRPQEACGTSGQKAALNGALNLSVLDGWWDEMYDGENGWSIPSAESFEDLARRDQLEAASLYDILEHQVVPLFYERFGGNVPRRWVRRVRHSLATLGPRVLATRMVKQYVEQLYEPVAARADRLATDGYTQAKQLAAFKDFARRSWGHVAIEVIESEDAAAELGGERRVEALVSLGDLGAGQVAVELVHGPVGSDDEISSAEISPMTPRARGTGAPARTTAASSGSSSRATSETTGLHCFEGSFKLETAGRYGFTVRVVPRHADLASAADAGCVRWA